MSRPAPLAGATLAQAGMELRLTARRGENLLAMIVIPVVVLLFFGGVAALPGTGPGTIGTLLPGALALAVVATSLVNLGIATGYERSYGVLKRLGGSPLGRSGLVVAKVAAILVVEVVQVGLLVGVAALVFGWRPGGEATIVGFALALVAGTAAFAGIGLAAAGALRAEATLALLNGLFLAFLLVGGLVVPASSLPAPLDALAGILPSAALADAFAWSLGSGQPDAGRAFAVLAVWAVGAIAVTVRSFRWS